MKLTTFYNLLIYDFFIWFDYHYYFFSYFMIYIKMVLEYFDINNLLDFKNPIHLYGFIAVIIWLMYTLHSDLGVLE